jgi:hypothetical protein
MRMAAASEYTTSATEVARRLTAFTTLICSVLAAMAASTIDLAMTHVWSWTASLVAIAAILLLFRGLFARSLGRMSRVVLVLTDTRLVRVDGQSRDEYALGDVVTLRTKRTVKGNAREIRIGTRAGRSVYINALQDFEGFAEALHERTSSANMIEIREPIDFDHPLFYMVFGVVMGLALTTTPRLLANVSDAGYRFFYYGFAAFLVALGVYWWFGTPISGRYGRRTRGVDYSISSLMVVAGLGVALLALLYLS